MVWVKLLKVKILLTVLKKVDANSLRQFRDRFDIPVSDEDLENLPYFRPSADSEEMKYMNARRTELGGAVPQRRQKFSEALEIPALEKFDAVLQGSGDREISTTMAFVRVLNVLVKDKKIGKRIVPIVPDEARTFGMEGMFRQLGIYSSEGQKYIPQDKDQVAYYKEDKKKVKYFKKVSMSLEQWVLGLQQQLLTL